ncbi:MAG: hypothetical protein IKT82_03725 [Bacteroidaceae bacterium]|nr:hypothetical protein [Bacteroidaceae bacterium]
MKKMILALMCMIAPSVFAQNLVEETTVKKSCPFALDFNLNGSSKNKGKQFFNSSIRLSYTPAWRLGVVGEVGSNLMLSDVNGDKDWDDALTLGGGLTFRLGDLLLDADTKQSLRFKITATMGSTVGNAAYNYTYYDAGITIMPTANLEWLGLNLGYRHCNSHNNLIPNYNGFYGGVVFKF